MARNALGRGLGALIRDSTETPSETAGGCNQSRQAQLLHRHQPYQAGAPLQVDIDLYRPQPVPAPNPLCGNGAPRELAQSIRNSGIIQPLVLRRIGPRYQLIAGERRWRAAQRSGTDASAGRRFRRESGTSKRWN